MSFSYRIDIRYIGRSFTGWQSQSSKDAVQDHLHQALATILREPVQLIGASRTDSGVHALGQVATFTTTSEIDAVVLMKSLNAVIPRDIGIKSVTPVASTFHPIRAAKSKLYAYRIWNAGGYNPFVAPYIWSYPYADLPLPKLKAGAHEFIGEHDFSAFCAANSGAKTRVRRIFDIEVEKQGDMLVFWILGNGFLKQMVRIMIGTLVEIATGKLQTPVSEILAKRDRTLAGATAPAQGLTLIKIFYDDVTKIDRAVKEAGEALYF
jgi:tRNA pseudouridine38-40 synthase